MPNDSLDFSIRNLGNGADHGIDVLWSARIDGDSTSDDPFVTDRTAFAEAVAAYFNDPNDPTLSTDRWTKRSNIRCLRSCADDET